MTTTAPAQCAQLMVALSGGFLTQPAMFMLLLQRCLLLVCRASTRKGQQYSLAMKTCTSAMH